MFRTRHRFRFAVLAALLAGSARASSVPEPLFVADPDGFTEQVAKGQSSELLEVHLTQYAVDPAWEAAWAAGRYRHSGVLAEYGSISARALLSRLDLALNLPASERLGLRYEQRRRADTRFDLKEERFDALWWAAPRLALVGSGWPTPHKQHVSLGGGVSLGSPGGGNQLTLLVRDDRYVFNQKTDTDVRFTRQPLRLLLDGFAGGDTWRAYGTLNLGTAYAARDRPEGAPARGARGRLQYGDAGVLWRGERVNLALTGRFVTQDRAEDRDGSQSLALDRSWWRVDGVLELRWGTWAAAARGGWARQRDRFFAAGDVDGTYHARNALFGAEGIYRGWASGELRLGYVGNVYRLQRNSTALGTVPPTLLDDVEKGYVDKVHLKGRYRFGPGLAAEALISKEISQGSFGGFSVRVLGQL